MVADELDRWSFGDDEYPTFPLVDPDRTTFPNQIHNYLSRSLTSRVRVRRRETWGPPMFCTRNRPVKLKTVLATFTEKVRASRFRNKPGRPLNTAQFIAELKRGSGPACDRLASDLFEPLWHFFTHRRHVPEFDAEELAQDVLMKVHSRVSAFQNDGRAKFTTWVFQIAMNCATDFHREVRPKQQEFTENDLPDRWHGQYAGRNAALLAELMEGLRKLSAEDQQILLWRAQDFTNADIGRWLGIKPDTIRVRYCRAKKKLGVSDDRPEEPGVSTGNDITE